MEKVCGNLRYTRVVNGKQRYVKSAIYYGRTIQKPTRRYKNTFNRTAYCAVMIDAVQIYGKGMWKFEIVFRLPKKEKNTRITEKEKHLLEKIEEEYISSSHSKTHQKYLLHK
jgi:hypothetical protein